MNPLEKAKKKYESIPVSDRLEETVEKSIQAAKLLNKEPKTQKSNSKIFYKWGLGIAAGLLLGFTFMVNVNTAFAAELQEIPVIGVLVRLVNIQSYQEQTEDFGISVSVPSLEQIGRENGNFSKKVNQEISDMCLNYVKDAKQRALEYKQAFMETGGTIEEWKAHNIQITVGYEIKSQSDNYLSFEVSGTENWSSAYGETKYYNLDLKNMQYITLKDLLGEDYVNIANNTIREQIAERTKSGKETFFTAEEGGFQSIEVSQQFYINQADNPVIVFDKYTIAPGAMGNVEFEIV